MKANRTMACVGLRRRTLRNDSFGYNTRSELTSATLGNANYAYAFDNIGNRQTASESGTASSYTTNNLNQYATIIETLGEAVSNRFTENPSSGNSSPTYFTPLHDADGNTVLIRTSTGTWQITYNAENRPTRFENVATQTIVECGYDSQGRRYFKKVTIAGTVSLHHRYIYRGYLQIAALDLLRSEHPALWFVTWDPSEPVATRPLAIQKDNTWFTYGYDITKNICEVFGQHGYIRTTYSYAPFGAVTASGDLTQPFQWSSEHYDSELGLVYYNYRHYSPYDGRFLSRDPIAEQGGRNLYAFVGNQNFNAIDSLGLAKSLTNKNCERQIERARKNPRIVELEKELKSTCGIPSFECECCDGTRNGYYTHSYFFGGTITICSNSRTFRTRPSLLDYVNTIAHELVHAIQHCNDDDADKYEDSCEKMMCMEIEAMYRGAYYNNQSSYGIKNLIFNRLSGYKEKAPCKQISYEDFRSLFDRIFESCKERNKVKK